MTRYGLSKMKQSVFMLASFERTCDHLFEAAFHGQKDPINGVSDSIIMGKPITIGTGAMGIIYDTPMDFDLTPRKTMLERADLGLNLLKAN